MAIIDRRGVSVSAVDSPVQGDPNPGLAIKAPVVVATTGSNIALSGVQSVDGVTVGNNNERVLVKDQTDQTQNGIYNASTGNWTRAIDCASNSSFTEGTLVVVTQGQTYAGVQFQLTTPNPIVLGTSAILWTAIEFPYSAFEWMVNGGGSTPAVGYADDFIIPFPCTIAGMILVADAPAGSMQADIFLGTTIADYPPNGSITGTDKPTLVAANSAQDYALSGWTRNLPERGLLHFKLLSISGITRWNLTLLVQGAGT